MRNCLNRMIGAIGLAALWLIQPAAAGSDGPAQTAQFIDAAKMSREQHPKLVAQFGGAYHDPQVRQYVRTIGNRIVQHTPMRGQRFTFTVLNSDIVNAFAMPGGYVYVTRGMLALANNEAELAGVLAHEIAHVTEKHGEERVQQSVLAQLGIGILSGVLDSDTARSVATVGAATVLSSYSRQHEFEADSKGVQYLVRSGYDPRAMATFLNKLIAEQRLQSTLASREGGEAKPSFLATHPRTQDRVQQALQQAGGVEIEGRRRGTADYMRRINGLYYGGDPDNGIVRGQRFIHPKLGFAFEVPPGFNILNGATKVTALGPQNSQIIFDFAPRQKGLSMADYVRRAGQKLNIGRAQSIRINGFPAATGSGRIQTRSGTHDVRLVAIAYRPDTIARFLFVTKPQVTQRYSQAFQRTTYSFRRAREGGGQPLRLRTTRVKDGETAQSYAARMPFPSHRMLRFRTLNGLGPNDELRPGQWVKYVSRR